jgi:hypothetical protein
MGIATFGPPLSAAHVAGHNFMSRREEIDAKRAKLAELRRLREEKRSASPNLSSETLVGTNLTRQLFHRFS